MKRVIPLLIVTLLAACAPTTQRPGVDSAAVEAERLEQQKLAMKQGFAQLDQVMRIETRLAIAGADLCGTDVSPKLGFSISGKNATNKDAAVAYASLFPESSAMTSVRYVVPGAPADKAGMKIGDTVTKVAGKPIDVNGDPAAQIKEAISQGGMSDFPLEVMRNGAPISMVLHPAKGCGYPVSITKDAAVNAFADGSTIHITRGMMDFVKSDEELALVIGHEMAHDFRGHIAAKRGNAIAGQVVGTILDILAAAGGVNTGGAFGNNMGMMAAGAFSQDFENEADYAGLYVMARAGYSIDGAPDFWRRMAIANPDAITMARSHPTTPERFVSLKATIDEIKAKAAKGEPLTPNEQPKQAAPQQPASALPGLSGP